MARPNKPKAAPKAKAAAKPAPAAPVVNPPDLDGDDNPGGSLPTLAFDLAEVAWSACHRWAAIKQVESKPWADMSDSQRRALAIEAKRLWEDPAYDMPADPDEPWESRVRGPLFAAVVRAVAR